MSDRQTWALATTVITTLTPSVTRRSGAYRPRARPACVFAHTLLSAPSEDQREEQRTRQGPPGGEQGSVKPELVLVAAGSSQNRLFLNPTSPTCMNS